MIEDSRSDDEVVRFVTTSGYGVVHLTRSGKLLTNEVADKAIRCFISRQPWSGGVGYTSKEKRKNRTGQARMHLVDFLAERDKGYRCVYCGKQLTRREATIEHVIPISKGGPDIPENMVLCCRECNSHGGNASLVVKVGKILKQKGDAMEKYGAPIEELSEGTAGYEDIKQEEKRKGAKDESADISHDDGPQVAN